MDRTIYLHSIKHNQTEEIKKIIGEIDINFLEENRVEVLYYAFPLIERIILEIFKIVPGADVEHIEQGIMKTPRAMVGKNDATQIFPQYILNLIEKYYSDDGIRNKLFHANNNINTITVNIDEIILLLVKILLILRNRIESNSVSEYVDIDKIN